MQGVRSSQARSGSRRSTGYAAAAVVASRSHGGRTWSWFASTSARMPCWERSAACRRTSCTTTSCRASENCTFFTSIFSFSRCSSFRFARWLPNSRVSCCRCAASAAPSWAGRGVSGGPRGARSRGWRRSGCPLPRHGTSVAVPRARFTTAIIVCAAASGASSSPRILLCAT